MKNKILLLITSILSLTSCNKTPSNAIKTVTNYDIVETGKGEYGRDITTDEFVMMIKSKQTFPLFFYSNTCSHCDVTKEVIKQYSKDCKALFYRLEYKYEEYNRLIELLSTVFNEDAYTPRLMLFKNGSLSYEVNSSKLQATKATRAILNKYFISSNITTLTTLKALEKYQNNHKRYFVHVYNSMDELGNKLYSEEFFSYANNTSVDLLAIEVNSLKEEERSNILGKFDLTDLDYTYLLDYNVSGKIKAINYNLDDGLEYKSYIRVLTNPVKG